MADLMSCAAAIQKAAPGMSDDDVEEVLSAIIRREKGMANRRGDSLRWAEVAAEETAAAGLARKIEANAKRAALLARTQRETMYRANPDNITAISDLITTSERAGVNRGRSAEAAQHEARNAYLGALVAGWDRAGVTPWLKSIDPETEVALAREIARLNGAPNIVASSDKQLTAAAESVVGVQRMAREEANAAGAWVRELEGRVTRQTHDRGRMERAGLDAWAAHIYQRLDVRTFVDAKIDPSDAKAVRGFLANIYANLVAGNHHVSGKGELDPLAGTMGGGALARGLSEDRVLHFTGPDAWIEYARQFSATNLVGSIVSEAEQSARNIGLMRVWGPNPENALEQDISRMADAARDKGRDTGDFTDAKKLADGQAKLRREWAVITGEGDRPGNVTAATVFSSIRALQSVTKLGGSMLASLPDVAVAASALRHEGIPFFEALGNQIAALLPGHNSGVRAEVSTRLLAGVNGLLGGLHHRLGYETNLPGFASKASDIFFKLNLQTWWTDANERGVATMLSNHIGDNLRHDWAAVPAQIKQTLGRFGVDEGDWQAMRGVELLKDGDGTPYFTPDMLGEDSRATREKMGEWFTQSHNGAMTKPGAYEKSILLQGSAPGTVMGETLRIFTQFKSYPLSFLTRHWSRELYREGQADFGGIAGLIAGTTILGYASMVLKEYAAGRNPRNPEDAAGYAKLATAAFTRGGGGGIYADYLFGDFNRFGGSLWATALGPTAGTVEDVAKTFATLRDRGMGQDGGNLPAQAVGLLTRHVIPTNIFYSKLAIDHLVTFHLQEAVNPGFLKRMERRVKKENDQTFWWSPSANSPFDR